jgi:hypothetical protein
MEFALVAAGSETAMLQPGNNAKAIFRIIVVKKSGKRSLVSAHGSAEAAEAARRMICVPKGSKIHIDQICK